MGRLIDTIQGTNQAGEVQKRSELVHAYFSHMDPDRWQGMTPQNLVGYVEALHRRLAILGPQGMRDSQKLEALQAEYMAELPVLGNKIDGLEMSAYDLLLAIARGVENFSVAPLSSAHRDASQE